MLKSLFCLGLAASLLLGGATAQAPEKPAATGFQAAFEDYQKGKDVRDALDRVIANETASAKERFNAAYLAAVIALDAGRVDDAFAMLDKAEKVVASQPQTSIRRAEAQIAKGDPKAAQKSLDKAAKEMMGKKGDLVKRLALTQASCDAALGAPQRAVERLEKFALGAGKNDWEVALALGRHYEMLDKPKDAIAAYERVIAADPKIDPFGGLIAYQRAAALAIGSDGGSYGKPDLAKVAVERYDIFTARAAANGIAKDVVDQAAQASDVLKSFVLRRKGGDAK